MNLMKIFNLNYLKQNIKKSLPIISFSTLFIVVINILYLFVITSGKRYGYVPDISEISFIMIVGMFVIPFVLAACLFDFMFKKKNIDFTCSMPITRKSMFVTNIVGGILIILGLIVISILTMFFVTLFTPLIIPFKLYIDFFLIFFISYLFVFFISCLSLSITGNMITGLAVALLIMFLIPCLRQYSYYKTLDSYQAHIENSNYEFGLDKVDQNTYNLPYYVVTNIISNDLNLYNQKQLFSMFILSIFNLVLGYFCFIHRKMEIAETSFGNFKVHNFVKLLTLVPIGLVFYELLQTTDVLFILFVFGFIVLYWFIYDLITRKKIENIVKSLNTFIVGFLLILLLIGAINLIKSNDDINIITIKLDDIKEIKIDTTSTDISMFGDELVINDKDSLDIIFSNLITDDRSYENIYYIDITFNINNKIYTTMLPIAIDDFNKIITKQLAEYNSIDYDKVYAIYDGTKYIDSSNSNFKKIIDVIKECDGIKKTDNLGTISLYAYVNHKLVAYRVPISISYEFQSLIGNISNDYVYNLENKSRLFYYVDEYNGVNSNYAVDIPDNDYYDLVFSDRVEYDSSKDTVVIRIYDIKDGMTYYYYTNKYSTVEKLYTDYFIEPSEDGDVYEY